MTIKKGRALMRKIGGVNMNTVAHLGKLTKEKTTERYCSVYESLKESLKEVKLIKQGKAKTKSWKELYNDLKSDEESD